MIKMNFRTLDIAGGWIAFIIATFTYVSTMEPTVSFWDCGEFIACAYKLQVGHPPGAPLFLMIGRFFSMWTAPDQAAYMVNLISALSSSFTILFLFWTISALARKILNKTSKEWNMGKTVAVIGSSMVGALAYTFSDTFWFSAVEAEVYAMSSLFTAIVFWGILRWERVSEEPGADRWLIFIAYMMGLSIGVHLLNLLAIPAIAFVFYFKKFKPTLKGIGVTTASAAVLKAESLTKQLETISVNSILENKSKNIIIDDEINGVKLRLQKVDGLPPKELRKLVDKGKKELNEGIIVVFASKDNKVGIAVGVTDKLTDQFDAVQFVKVGSEIIGGKGGGGRKDFAQAGGQDQSKIEEAFEKLKTLI